MNRRRLLGIAVVGSALIGIGVAAVPFVQSLAPSERAKKGATFIVPLASLEPGALQVLRVGYRSLFVLRPSTEQRKSITQLDAHVWNAAPSTYVNELEAFVYWGESTKWGCALQEKKPPDSWLTEYSHKGTWLGGFWDPVCEVSYDYAGRTIRTYDFTYNGYTGEFPNLK